jgi:putative ABC transport system ATP-binding protein
MQLFIDLNNNGKTIILVTHEPDIAAYAKRLIRMRDGQIISDEPVVKQMAGATDFNSPTPP